MALIRRTLVVIALMFWQGGFTFYVAVVVPVGTAVLGSAADQGAVTRQVTQYLNLSGAVALPLLLWDTLTVRPWRRSRLAAWAAMLAALAALTWLHPQLDALFDHDAVRVLDRSRFRPLHRLYLWLSTGQWAAGVAFVVLSVVAWQRHDREAAR